jgi:hypothetical protein
VQYYSKWKWLNSQSEIKSAYISNTLGATKLLLADLESLAQIINRVPSILQERKKLTTGNYRHNTRNQINKIVFWVQLVEDLSSVQECCPKQCPHWKAFHQEDTTNSEEMHVARNILCVTNMVKGRDTMTSNCALFSWVSWTPGWSP